MSFREVFGDEPEGAWAAPGRVNLIGEHTDYNDGFVLPFALPQRTVVEASTSDGGEWTVWSAQSGETVTFDEHELTPGAVGGWGGYVAGLVWSLRESGYHPPPARLAIHSDVPVGAGLSSSAALECSVLAALVDLGGLSVPTADRPRIAQRAENQYVGVPSGIMDQSASVLCREGHALFLDCRSLAIDHIPFDLSASGASESSGSERRRENHGASESSGSERRRENHGASESSGSERRRENHGASESSGSERRRENHGASESSGSERRRENHGLAILVIDTRAPHRHTDNEYAVRRASCEAAAQRLGLAALRDVTDLSAALAALPDEVMRKRVRHVVTENARVVQTVDLLRDGRRKEIGPLMTASHASMRDDYEITVPEVDTAVEAALHAGAYGARMTGGGFGGCVLALIETPAADEVAEAVVKAFAEHGFNPPTSFVAVPSAGATRLS